MCRERRGLLDFALASPRLSTRHNASDRGTKRRSYGLKMQDKMQDLESGMARKRQARKSTARRSKAGKPTQRAGRRWSARVTRESDALDLQHGVFSKRSPKAIARSLKRSAERSHRRKGRSLPVGDVDADLLHQPRRQEPARQPKDRP
jgi:phage gp16-like protein